MTPGPNARISILTAVLACGACGYRGGPTSTATAIRGDAVRGTTPPADVTSTTAGTSHRAGFVHPGILISRAGLDFVKARLADNAEPWTTAFARTANSPFASLSYAPRPLAVVECGSYSRPDIGCTAEKNDATAAYTHALLWYLSGDERHALKAIEILNAWSAVLTAHTNSNAPLQSAWASSVFPRAAEIIRATYPGWSPAGVAQFATMLKTIYLPQVVQGAPSTNGNWELSMIEASIAIAVFVDDRATFDGAVAMWKRRVPAYIYLTTDGPHPLPPPGGKKDAPSALVKYWYDQNTFVDGLSQETCRDLGHVQYGLAAMINAAETAFIQGVDLYRLEATRLAAGLEFHAHYLNGAPVPAWLCSGFLGAVAPDPMWEIGYNALAGRLGLAMPQTKALLDRIRPVGTTHHMNWETLTHAEAAGTAIIKH